MKNLLNMTRAEEITSIVYGDTFALYDEKEFDEFIKPLYIRLKNNKINPSIFRGKRCLDAGCGGGRGSILMAQCGAREVIGVDLSPINVESSRKRAIQKGFKNIKIYQSSLVKIPFPDESFDFVWCNGVLHHTINPDQGLKEITRVLKINGNLWLYLYGSGGIYWFVIDWIRQILKKVDVKNCIWQLRLMNEPARRIAEWIDDWFAPYLRRYTNIDVKSRLKELGYENINLLKYGTVYDTSQRKVKASRREMNLMGEGDLRYLCKKVSISSGENHVLPDPPDGLGSKYKNNKIVTIYSKSLNVLKENILKLESIYGFNQGIYRIIVCKIVHSTVRNMLEKKEKIELHSLEKNINNLNVLICQLIK